MLPTVEDKGGHTTLKYWYEDHFVKGINYKVLHQVIRCNLAGPHNEHIGMVPVWEEWL